MRIRSFMLAGIASLGLSPIAGPAALAADYPVLRGSQIEDAPQAPSDFFGSYNWSGFYVGGFAGQTQTRFRTDRGVMDTANGLFNATIAINEFSPGELVRTLPRDDRGTTFGGFAGYNMAFGEAVIGFEAEYSRVDQSSSASTLEARLIPSGPVAVASVQDVKLSDYINARLRFGYAYGRLMPYFTIGAAAGRFDTNVAVGADWRPSTTSTASYFGFPRSAGGPKKDVWGYGMSVGGGVEAALTDNIILRGEYLFTRFNNVEGVTVNVNTARVAAGLKF